MTERAGKDVVRREKSGAAAADVAPVSGPPSRLRLDAAATLLSGLAPFTAPRFYGIDRVPDDGVLLVGNHTMYGIFDVPFMLAALWRRNGLAVRGLGDHRHYSVPVWRELLTQLGVVRGTRANVDQLMARREPILVFPGGAREANKRRGEKYELIWKNRLGFATMAIKHEYPIVPFAAVGGEEMFDVLIDEHDPIYGKLVGAARSVIGWPLPSIAFGLGPTPIPRPRRLYFWFGEPIDSGLYGGGEHDIRRLRDDVRDEVSAGIALLRDQRHRDLKRLRRPQLPARAATRGARAKMSE